MPDVLLEEHVEQVALGRTAHSTDDIDTGEPVEGRGSVPWLVGLRPEGRAPVREGTEIQDGDGRIVGRVTSGAFSPTLGAPVAMAHVESANAATGTRLQAILRGKPVAAEVVKLPFVPHNYHRQEKA